MADQLITGTTLIEDKRVGADNGTYTPTFTIVTNLDSVIGDPAMFYRVGDIITVTGNFTVDATANANVRFRMSLPISTSFSNTFELSGLTATQADSVKANRVIADTTNNEADFLLVNTGTGPDSKTFILTYRVI